MILQVIAAYVATVSFSLLFNAPKKELIFCGLTGSVSWFFFRIVADNGGSQTLGVFVAVIAVTYLCRILSFKRKVPITIFLVSAIIPLVPGTIAYYTMFGFVTGDTASASYHGMECLKMAGGIAIGIVMVLSLPRKLVIGSKR